MTAIGIASNTSGVFQGRRGRPSVGSNIGHPQSWVGRAAGRGQVSKSLVHLLSLFAVWLTIATSGLVFSEPAPVDALSMGLVILLPVVGLVTMSPSLLTYLAVWLMAAAGGFMASAFAVDVRDATVFTTISLYLYAASFVIAAFVAKRPMEHLRLILQAWTVAAVAAAAAGLIGYFSLLPGAYDLFTKFGRAAGTFKDPNVFGPFLVVPLLYLLHLVVTRPLTKVFGPLALAALLTVATLLSFSRGAWAVMACGVLIYGYLAYVTAPGRLQRERIAAILVLGLMALGGVLAAAAQVDRVSELLMQRATLSQSYDVGPEGRFAGQAKALELIAKHPLGLGAGTFSQVHHGEDVHNVYLSMFLKAGWLGGGAYLVMTLSTLALGFLHLLKAGPMRPLFIVLYAAFAATALEGLIIDTDHWRHFYLLMGLIWGVMFASSGGPGTAAPASRVARPARIVGRSSRLVTK